MNLLESLRVVPAMAHKPANRSIRQQVSYEATFPVSIALTRIHTRPGPF